MYRDRTAQRLDRVLRPQLLNEIQRHAERDDRDDDDEAGTRRRLSPTGRSPPCRTMTSGLPKRAANRTQPGVRFTAAGSFGP